MRLQPATTAAFPDNTIVPDEPVTAFGPPLAHHSEYAQVNSPVRKIQGDVGVEPPLPSAGVEEPYATESHTTATNELKHGEAVEESSGVAAETSYPAGNFSPQQPTSNSNPRPTAAVEEAPGYANSNPASLQSLGTGQATAVMKPSQEVEEPYGDPVTQGIEETSSSLPEYASTKASQAVDEPYAVNQGIELASTPSEYSSTNTTQAIEEPYAIPIQGVDAASTPSNYAYTKASQGVEEPYANSGVDEVPKTLQGTSVYPIATQGVESFDVSTTVEGLEEATEGAIYEKPVQGVDNSYEKASQGMEAPATNSAVPSGGYIKSGVEVEESGYDKAADGFVNLSEGMDASTAAPANTDSDGSQTVSAQTVLTVLPSSQVTQVTEVEEEVTQSNGLPVQEVEQPTSASLPEPNPKQSANVEEPYPAEKSTQFVEQAPTVPPAVPPYGNEAQGVDQSTPDTILSGNPYEDKLVVSVQRPASVYHSEPATTDAFVEDISVTSSYGDPSSAVSLLVAATTFKETEYSGVDAGVNKSEETFSEEF